MRAAYIILSAIFISPLSSCSNPSSDTLESSNTTNLEPATSSTSNTTNTRPNVIWIVLDACRTNLGCYGYDRPVSPNMDAIADRGAVFLDHYTTENWTVRSMSSYLSGRYWAQPTVGDYGTSLTNIYFDDDNEKIISEIFAENGYATTMVSPENPYFTATKPLMCSFDRWIGIPPKTPPLTSFEELNPEVLSYLEEDHDDPFFLYIHTVDTHFPHYFDAPYDRWVNQEYDESRILQSNLFTAKTADGSPFSSDDKDYLMALHDASINYADDHIGKIVEKLNEQGLLENSIIIIGSDHGDALGEDGKTVGHGAISQDEVMRIPLIMAGPGIPNNTRFESLSSNVDIVPTLIDLLEFRTNATTDGISLLPAILNPKSFPPQEQIFYHSRTVWGARSKEYKYEINLSSKEDALYAVPDHVANERINLIDEQSQIASEFKELILQKVAPRVGSVSKRRLAIQYWNIGKLLNRSNAKEDGVLWASATPLNSHKSDNLWCFSSNQLVSVPESENAPPLTLRRQIRTDRFKLVFEILSGPPSDTDGRETALNVRVGSETEFRKIVSPPTEGPIPKYQFVELGIYSFKGGNLEIEIDDIPGTVASSLKSLVLIADDPLAQSKFETLMLNHDESTKDIEERIEQLRALGYLE